MGRAEHYVGSDKRHWTLDQGRTRGVSAHGTFIRKGAGGRKHGRSGRRQFPAPCRRGPRRHRDICQECSGRPRPSRPRFPLSAGKMFSGFAELRGRDGIRPDSESDPSGAELFQGNCTSCHSAEGQGSKDGYYPSLFWNSAAGAKNATNLIATILYGVNRTTSGGQAFMPGFGGRTTDANALSDRDVVLGNYVLTHYGSVDTTITEQQVAEERRGGPSSPLLALARGSMAAAAVVVFLGIAHRPTTKEFRLICHAQNFHSRRSG
jgi:mono/diheme cytochrome c family protein